MDYTVTDEESQSVTAMLGTLVSQSKNRLRYLDITLRVGQPQLDNYHLVNGQRGRSLAATSFLWTTSPTRSAAESGWTRIDLPAGIAAFNRDQIEPGNEGEGRGWFRGFFQRASGRVPGTAASDGPVDSEWVSARANGQPTWQNRPTCCIPASIFQRGEFPSTWSAPKARGCCTDAILSDFPSWRAAKRRMEWT